MGGRVRSTLSTLLIQAGTILAAPYTHSKHTVAKWILTSQHWVSHSRGEKRARHIDFIVQNLTSKVHIWFYFDIHHGQWLYLNGEKRDSINP